MKFNTRLYIEGVAVDLTDRFEGSINYSLDNIKDISTISSNYTTTITLPGTNLNCQLFNWLFNPKNVGSGISGSANIGANFDFKRKARACLIQDGQVIFDNCYAQLISATNTNGLYSFDIQISGIIASLIYNLGDTRLQDLFPASGSTRYDHLLTLENITGSWYNSSSDATEASDKKYLYPLADYGQFETVQGMSHLTQNLRPCLYVKQYWDMCMETASFTYSSDFITSSYFQSLVMPFKDGDMTFPQGNFAVGDASTLNFTYSESIVSRSVDDAPDIFLFNDVSNGSNLINGAFIPTVASIYSFTVNFDFQFIFSVSEMYDFIDKGNTDIFGYVQVASFNISDDNFQRSIYQTFKFPANLVTFPGTVASSSIQTVDVTNDLFVDIGQYAKVTVKFASNGRSEFGSGYYFTTEDTIVPGLAEVFVFADEFATISVDSSGIVDGNTISFQNFVPKDIKCADFVQSVLRTWNLYPVADPDRKQHLIIKTHDEFYNPTKIKTLDWTNKLSTSEEFKVTPIPQISTGFLLYQMRPDTDWYNQYYSNLNTGGVYGALRADLGYEFSQDIKDVLDGTIFSPTVPVVYSNNSIPGEANCECTGSRISVVGYSASLANGLAQNTGSLGQDGFIRSRIGVGIIINGQPYTITEVTNPQSFFVDRSVGTSDFNSFDYITNSNPTILPYYQSKDNNVTRSTLATNPKVVFYNGLRPVKAPIYIQYTPQLTSISYSYYTGPINSGGYYYKTDMVPHCSHLNDDLFPTADLNFLEPTEVFFPIVNYPTSSLFNFHENSTLEIADPEAKQIDCKLKLNSIDIANLDFSNKIYIDGTTYRISSINDYTSNPNETTSATLVRSPFQNYKPTSSIPPSPPIPPGSVSGSFNIAVSMSQFTGAVIHDIQVASQSVFYSGTGSNFPLSGSQNGLFTASLLDIQFRTVRMNISSSRFFSDFITLTDSSTTQSFTISFSGSGVVDASTLVVTGSTMHILISGSQGDTGSYSQMSFFNSSSNSGSLRFAPSVGGVSGSLDFGLLPTNPGQFSIFDVITGSSETVIVNLQLTGSKILALSASSGIISASVSSSGNYTFNAINTINSTQFRLLDPTGSIIPPVDSGSVIVSNQSPDAVIHSTIGINGYNLPVALNFGEFLSGSHSAIGTGSIGLLLTHGPSEVTIMNYAVNNINKSSVSVPLGFTGNIFFTYSQSVAISESIQITLQGPE